LDAVIENGQLVGGCDCVCDPSTAIDPASCQFPATYSESACGCVCPYWAPDPLSCESPTEFIPALCQCGCPGLGRVGGPCTVNGHLLRGSAVRADCSCDERGAAALHCPGNQEVDPITGHCQCPERTAQGTWYPLCRYPLAKDPISCDCVPSTTSSPTKLPTASPLSDVVVVAGGSTGSPGHLGPRADPAAVPVLAVSPQAVVVPNEVLLCVGPACSCSGQKPCTIQCISPDACKDSFLLCPVHHHCILICSHTACDKVHVTAPIGHDFTVECDGDSSCMNAIFVASEARDVSYSCGGADSCKGAMTTLNCGTGSCDVQCLGDVSCGAAVIVPGAAAIFKCFGAFATCPPDYTPHPVPAPTMPTMPPTSHCHSNPECPCEMQHCFEVRNMVTCECSCPLEILRLAHEGSNEICGRDSVLSYHPGSCACDCPIGSEPPDGCPGNQVLDKDLCRCACPNEDECAAGGGVLNSVTCECLCPPWSPREEDCFSLNKELRNCECQCPHQCTEPGHIQSRDSCACGCPRWSPRETDCQAMNLVLRGCRCVCPNECPVFGSTMNVECECECPSWAPDPASCPTGHLDPLTCECSTVTQPPSKYCCLTTIAGFTPYAGRCWGVQKEAACAAVPDNVCRWDPLHCLPSPPVNSMDPSRPCVFRDLPCVLDADCCSEVCRSNGFCR